MSNQSRCAIESLEHRMLLSEVIASFKTTQYGSHTFLFNSHSSNSGDAKKIEKALWRFGDGTHAYGGIVWHTFASAGTFNVSLTVTNGLAQSDRIAHPVVAGSTVNTGSIVGRVFSDINGNGVRDSTKEGYLRYVPVWLDLNTNFVRDAGEPGWVSDIEGRYEFRKLGAGTFTVYAQPENPIVGFERVTRTATIVAGGMYTAPIMPVRIGAKISGSVFQDQDQDGIHDWYESYGGQDRLVWLDEDGDGVPDLTEPSTNLIPYGGFDFAGLAPGMHRIRMVLRPGETQISPRPGRGLDVNVGYAATVYDARFAIRMPVNTSVSGRVFNDIDGDTVVDAGEKFLGGQNVFLDFDEDEQLDPGETTAVTDSKGRYTLPMRAAEPFSASDYTPTSDAHPRLLASTGFRQSRITSHQTDYDSTKWWIEPGKPNIAVDLGRTATAGLFGSTYYDQNLNGKEDSDDNSNGFHPPGTVFADLNDNDLIDDNEPQATVAENGNWIFPIGLAPGDYIIRYLPRTSGGFTFVYTEPSGGHPLARVTVSSGQEKTIKFGVSLHTQ